MANRSDCSNGSADVVLVCPHLGDGGAQRVLCTLANAWIRRGRTVDVITLYGSEDVYPLDPRIRRTRVLKAQGIKRAVPRAPGLRTTISHRYTLYKSLFQQVRKLRRAIKESRAPVVVSFTGSANVMTVLACAGLDTRVVISERNDPARQILKHPWNALRPLVYNRADLVTANSRGALAALRAYVDPDKLAFVPNPLVVDHKIPPPGETRAAEQPAILTVGRLHEQKAHDVLLDAFALVAPRLPAWRLILVGRGQQEEALRAQATRLGISARIDWCGHVADPYVFYRKARLFVLPSRHEGMPNALLEALSCGLPAIVSDGSPGPLELIIDGETGLVVPVSNAAALAGAIERLATDQDLCRHLSGRARACVLDYEMEKSLPVWERAIGWREQTVVRAEARPHTK
jgi:GalNAc-alpha-(1->4)-GalNAc-alpha-(1->3)-diNAcBac-PP-undecaprenol alpha-1,4-N-acetyl-D-galactosaminyltransferase